MKAKKLADVHRARVQRRHGTNVVIDFVGGPCPYLRIAKPDGTYLGSIGRNKSSVRKFSARVIRALNANDRARRLEKAKASR